MPPTDQSITIALPYLPADGITEWLRRLETRHSRPTRPGPSPAVVEVE